MKLIEKIRNAKNKKKEEKNNSEQNLKEEEKKASNFAKTSIDAQEQADKIDEITRRINDYQAKNQKEQMEKAKKMKNLANEYHKQTIEGIKSVQQQWANSILDKFTDDELENLFSPNKRETLVDDSFLLNTVFPTLSKYIPQNRVTQLFREKKWEKSHMKNLKI